MDTAYSDTNTSPVREETELALSQALERLREYEARLRESDRRKDEFLATLAHELRNPLAPLRNGLQIMKLAAGDSEAIAHTRGMMERQLEHLVRLVNDLLDLSRVNRGDLVLRKTPTDIAAVVRAALETARPMIAAAGRTLSVVLPEEVVPMEADLTRLSQVLGNLLDNAVKYTHRNGRIWLKAERSDGEVRISVRDNGAGIASAQLGQVFESFAQMTPSIARAEGGLGIGLSIVKRLVALHGGSVEAHSAGPGTGAEFVVRLPLGATAAPALPAAESSAPGKDSLPSRRILVVDDNMDAATSLALLLEIGGNQLRTAHEGRSALEIAATFRPEVIFLDIGLPGMDGYEVCRRIRAQSWGGGIAILALTGWGQAHDIRQARAAGFDRHLIKPVDVDGIEEVLRDLQSNPGRLRIGA